MELYYAFSVIIVLAALFSYVNVRYVKLPMTIGIIVIAMMISVGVRLFGGEVFTGLAHRLESLLQGFDFTEILMGAMLNFLLFAGALHININDLKNFYLCNYQCSTFGFLYISFAVLHCSFGRNPYSLRLLSAFWCAYFSNRPYCSVGSTQTSEST